jgi:plastocyanin domain-containing protein
MPQKTLAAAATLAVLAFLPSPALAQRGQGTGQPAPAPAIAIAVTGDGFVPARLEVKKGQKVRLVVTRQTDRTCATEIVIRDQGIHQKLPLGQPVTVEFTPMKSGQLRYACGMDMISGVIVVE